MIWEDEPEPGEKRTSSRLGEEYFFFFLPQKPVERVTIPHNQDTNDSLTGSKDALLTRMHRIIYKVMSSARSHLLSLLFPLFIRSKRRTHSHDQSWKTGVERSRE